MGVVEHSMILIPGEEVSKPSLKAIGVGMWTHEGICPSDVVWLLPMIHLMMNIMVWNCCGALSPTLDKLLWIWLRKVLQIFSLSQKPELGVTVLKKSRTSCLLMVLSTQILLAMQEAFGCSRTQLQLKLITLPLLNKKSMPQLRSVLLTYPGF